MMPHGLALLLTVISVLGGASWVAATPAPLPGLILDLSSTTIGGSDGWISIGDDSDLASQMLLAQHAQKVGAESQRETTDERSIASSASTYIGRLRTLRQQGRLPQLPSREDIRSSLASGPGAPLPPAAADQAASGASAAAPSTGPDNSTVSDVTLLRHTCHNKKLMAQFFARRASDSELIYLIMSCGSQLYPDFHRDYLARRPRLISLLMSDQHAPAFCDAALDVHVAKWPVDLCGAMSAECFRHLGLAGLGLKPACVKVIPPQAFSGFVNASWVPSNSLAAMSAAQARQVPNATCFTLRALMVKNALMAHCIPVLPKVTLAPFVPKMHVAVLESGVSTSDRRMLPAQRASLPDLTATPPGGAPEGRTGEMEGITASPLRKEFAPAGRASLILLLCVAVIGGAIAAKRMLVGGVPGLLERQARTAAEPASVSRGYQPVF
mgnify:FL=1